MAQDYRALTEKEKETLRLLARGYDAKSTALALGLSVHTVNERLRDARRKMSVSSSREAARLLRDAEPETPQLLVPKSFGGASAAIDGAILSHTEGQHRTSRHTTWVIGGAVMSVSLALLAYASIAGNPAARNAPDLSASRSAETESASAARHWLELGDASDWKASYAATAASFRSVNTLALWESTSKSVRVPLGRVISRQLIDDIDTPTPPNGNHVVRFRARFANKPDAIETVALKREDGQWRVVGVYLE